MSKCIKITLFALFIINFVITNTLPGSSGNTLNFNPELTFFCFLPGIHFIKNNPLQLKFPDGISEMHDEVIFAA